MTDNRRIATVTQINNYIKALLDQVPVLHNVWIKGEISNFKRHSSGHIYLTLKDDGAVLKAVMFKSAAYALTFKPEDGMKVLARGRISVYEAGGQYQMYIEEMTSDGQGDLYKRFEELKKKLGEEGLFDEARKKTIPKFPEKIGVATSPTGAAVRDMINVLRRRCPMVKVIIYPCLVQGDGAAKSVSEAIRYFNDKNNVDVIIAGRGGGSIEDLWAFNEEITVRTVAESKIPVISAVGHETDFTLCDFAADLRAPTPSAAAELAVPDIIELKRFIDSAKATMAAHLKQKLLTREKQLELLSKSSSITRFNKSIMDRHQTLDRLDDALVKNYSFTVESYANKFALLAQTLSALSPLEVFKRGYCSVEKDNKIVSSTASLNKGDNITLRLHDGEADCEIIERRLFDEI
ncbi:MAG: exodeoxyribonuclease VII large subunit [Clostridia bacterium]|nr:exodeoxyribonuclease VII large subunit [Clostridia bacterium]